MRAAANFAWCNRQLLTHQAREVFADGLRHALARSCGMDLVYDVCPQHRQVRGARRRRRRTQAGLRPPQGGDARLPAGPSRDAARLSRRSASRCIIPGDMGRASWVLAGQPGSMEQTFGTTCHGAGRLMSRTAAVEGRARGRRIDKELDARGIIARPRGRKGLAEEQPAAYKDVDDVVEVVDSAGHLQEGRPARPIGVIKG